MKEQFVTYEIALKLKELGFDEECFANYNIMETFADEDATNMIRSKVLYLEYENQYSIISPLWFEKDFVREMWVDGSYWDGEHSRCEVVDDGIKAPLWQQAIDWFREKHQLYIQIVFSEIIDDNLYPYYYYIIDMKTKLVASTLSKNIKEFNDALKQAILKAIELITQQV